MPRITNEEIAELKLPYQERVTFHDSLGLVDDESPKIIAVLDRLAELEARNEVLEAAVAFKGFDEVPEKGKFAAVQYLSAAGIINTRNVCDFDIYRSSGYIGWRYPVGDLS